MRGRDIVCLSQRKREKRQLSFLAVVILTENCLYDCLSNFRNDKKMMIIIFNNNIKQWKSFSKEYFKYSNNNFIKYKNMTYIKTKCISKENAAHL